MKSRKSPPAWPGVAPLWPFDCVDAGAGGAQCGVTEFLTALVRANSTPLHLRMQNGDGLLPKLDLSTERDRASRERTSSLCVPACLRELTRSYLCLDGGTLLQGGMDNAGPARHLKLHSQ